MILIKCYPLAVTELANRDLLPARFHFSPRHVHHPTPYGPPQYPAGPERFKYGNVKALSFLMGFTF
jgi:hypothetical protein